MRIEGTRLDAKERPPLDRHPVFVCKTVRRVLCLPEHHGEDVGVERALIDRNLRDTRYRGDDPGFDLHHAHRAYDARAGPRMAPGDFTAFERRGRGGQEGVPPHRNGRGPRMRGLADEPHHVSFEAEGSKDHPGGAIQ